MANGRRRNGPGAGRRAATTGRRAAPARGAPAGRRAAGPRGGYDVPASGIGGLHPAVLIGMIVIPVLLVVVIVLAASSGGDDGKKKSSTRPEMASTDTTAPDTSTAPEPAAKEKPVPRPTQAEMDTLEAGMRNLRTRANRMRTLRDEGAAAWREEDHTKMQEKFHAANREWQIIRDRYNELMSPFSDEQIDRYLGRYEIDMIEWRKIFKSFSKHIAIGD